MTAALQHPCMLWYTTYSFSVLTLRCSLHAVGTAVTMLSSVLWDFLNSKELISREMSQGRGAYPCPTPMHDVLWGIVNFTFHLHRLLFLMRHLHPKDSEVRTTKIQCNEISFLYVGNKTQVIKNCMQHKSEKYQTWLNAALKQMSSPYSASCRAPTWIWFHWSDSLNLAGSWCNGNANHHWCTGNCNEVEFKTVGSLYPDLMMKMAEQRSQERPKRDVESRDSKMKGCQITDKQL